MTSSSQKIVYFTEQQLIKIYEATCRSSDINVIRAKATELYQTSLMRRALLFGNFRHKDGALTSVTVRMRDRRLCWSQRNVTQ